MKTLALTTLLSLSLAARAGSAGEVAPAHSCDGNVCRVDFPPLPDASVTAVEDPFAPPPAPVTQSRPAVKLDLDPRHAPAPVEAPGVFRRPLLAWGIIGASVATVVASVLVVRRLDSRPSHGTEVEVESIRAGLAAPAPVH